MELLWNILALNSGQIFLTQTTTPVSPVVKSFWSFSFTRETTQRQNGECQIIQAFFKYCCIVYHYSCTDLSQIYTPASAVVVSLMATSEPDGNCRFSLSFFVPNPARGNRQIMVYGTEADSKDHQGLIADLWDSLRGFQNPGTPIDSSAGKIEVTRLRWPNISFGLGGFLFSKSLKETSINQGKKLIAIIQL